MRIILTEHAKEQMDLRGIEEHQIEKAIKRGSKTRQTDGWLGIYEYIAVAYTIRRNKYIIKTVMII